MIAFRARTARRLPVALRAGLSALLLAGLSAAPAAAQAPSPPPQRQVTVQNETDLTLRELYLAPPGARDRGPDRLGADTVAPGATLAVTLLRVPGCVLDLVAVFQDDREERRPRLDICRTPRILLGDPATPRLEVAVANRSQVVLRELYVSRPLAGDAARDATRDAMRPWGPDRLGASVIEPGGSFALRLRSRECVFDLRAVYDDEREEMLPGLDLCRARAVAFDRSTIPSPTRRGIVLANRHLAPVLEVYLSASTEADWGPDRLGANTLPVGADAAVEMEGGCEADLRIVFANGGAEERRALDICETQRVVLRPGWVLAENLSDEGPVVAPEPEPIPGALRLRNAGRLPIVEIYTPRPGEPRGEDRLGADTLPVGAVIEIEPEDPGACEADLVVVFRDGREVATRGLDLCAGEEIEVR